MNARIRENMPTTAILKPLLRSLNKFSAGVTLVEYNNSLIHTYRFEILLIQNHDLQYEDKL